MANLIKEFGQELVSYASAFLSAEQRKAVTVMRVYSAAVLILWLTSLFSPIPFVKAMAWLPIRAAEAGITKSKAAISNSKVAKKIGNSKLISKSKQLFDTAKRFVSSLGFNADAATKRQQLAAQQALGECRTPDKSALRSAPVSE